MMVWKPRQTPRRKADYIGAWLMLDEDVPPQWWSEDKPMPVFRPRKGDVVRIASRLSNKMDYVSGWGEIRILRIYYNCGHCHTRHSYFIPEKWLEEGLAHFVERA